MRASQKPSWPANSTDSTSALPILARVLPSIPCQTFGVSSPPLARLQVLPPNQLFGLEAGVVIDGKSIAVDVRKGCIAIFQAGQMRSPGYVPGAGRIKVKRCKPAGIPGIYGAGQYRAVLQPGRGSS